MMMDCVLMCRNCGLGAMENGVPVLIVTENAGDLRCTYKAGRDGLFQLGCYSRNSIQELLRGSDLCQTAEKPTGYLLVLS